MSIEEIKNISAEECEARIAEIRSEMNAEDADLVALSAEVDAIEERKSLLIKAEEENPDHESVHRRFRRVHQERRR